MILILNINSRNILFSSLSGWQTEDFVDVLI